MNERVADDLVDRAAIRQRLLARRAAMSATARAELDACIIAHLQGVFAQLGSQPGQHSIALYWPIRSEPDVRPLLPVLHQAGWQVALPYVEQRGQPLSFLLWEPNALMLTGEYGIPRPAVEKKIMPQLLVIPCVGFDAQCYRLGYGGGYYDRTLAEAPCATIGVAYGEARLDSIAPAAHDRALDMIVSEKGVEALREARAWGN